MAEGAIITGLSCSKSFTPFKHHILNAPAGNTNLNKSDSPQNTVCNLNPHAKSFNCQDVAHISCTSSVDSKSDRLFLNPNASIFDNKPASTYIDFNLNVEPFFPANNLLSGVDNILFNNSASEKVPNNINISTSINSVWVISRTTGVDYVNNGTLSIITDYYVIPQCAHMCNTDLEKFKFTGHY